MTGNPAAVFSADEENPDTVPPVKWKVQLISSCYQDISGPFYSSLAALTTPAVDRYGTVYVGDIGGQDVFAVNPDGSLKWYILLNNDSDCRQDIYLAPVVDDAGKNLYLVSSDLVLYSISAVTGRLRWRKDFIVRRYAPAIGADGTVYVGSDALYALTPDGTVKWVYDERDVESSPVIGADGTIYVATDDKSLIALNPNGTLEWETGLSARFTADSYLALDREGTIYVGAYINLYAVDRFGYLLWEHELGKRIVAAPVIGPDGTVYLVSTSSRKYYLHAVAPDGSLKWTFGVRQRIVGTPAVGRDGTIYFGTGNISLMSWPTGLSGGNYFYAVNPDGTLKWELFTDGPIFSAPAITYDGTIYFGVGGDNWFYALDSGAGDGLTDSPWPQFRGNLQNTGRLKSYEQKPPAKPCDYNSDNKLNIVDVIYYIIQIRQNPEDPELDRNGDEKTTTGDVVSLLRDILNCNCKESSTLSATAGE
ncbi:PQQ-binding-like beta-propeller repeat protein [Gemmatimonadota bacterium]